MEVKVKILNNSHNYYKQLQINQIQRKNLKLKKEILKYDIHKFAILIIFI